MPEAVKTSVFRNEYLSASRLKSYEQCPRAFYFHYVDPGPKAPRTNDAADFGVVLHAALEAFFKFLCRYEHSGALSEEQYRILNETYAHAWTESKLVGWGSFEEGQRILNAYFATYATLDASRVLAAEQEFLVPFGRFSVKGYLDRVDSVSTTTVRVVDYKSNRALYTQNELDTDLQASIYAVVARELYPQAADVWFEFHMLRFDGLAQSARRPSRVLPAVREYVIALGERIESDTTWEPKLNAHCSYCDHRLRCPAYEDAVKGQSPVVGLTKETSLEELAEARERLHVLSKITYAKKAELDDLFKAKLKEEGAFSAGGFEFKLQNSFRKEYADRSAVLSAFVEAGMSPAEADRELLTIDADAVERVRIEQTARLDRFEALRLKAKLELLATKVALSPKLDVRKVKKGS